jgi:hypothetical protein
VLAGGDEQLAGVVDPDRQQLQEPGRGPTDQCGQPLISQGDLGLEQLDAAGDCLPRRLAGLGWVGQESLVGSEPGAGGDQLRHRPPSASRTGAGAVTSSSRRCWSPRCEP